MMVYNFFLTVIRIASALILFLYFSIVSILEQLIKLFGPRSRNMLRATNQPGS